MSELPPAPGRPARARRVLQRIAIVLKWLGIANAAVILFIVVINLRDEDLTPEARELATVHKATVPDAQNAYLFLVGFSAPAGRDPGLEGARIVAEHNAASVSDPLGQKRLPQLREQFEHPETSDGLRFTGDPSLGCDPFEKSCVAHAQARPALIDTALTSNAELVSRYVALQRLDAYANTALPDLLGPSPLVGWTPIRRVLLAQAASEALLRHPERALSYLESDVAFWRRALSGDVMLIDSMLALRVLAEDFRVLSDLLALPDFDADAHAAMLRRIIVPLAPNERSLSHAFKREFELSAQVVRGLRDQQVASEDLDWDRWFGQQAMHHLLYQPNASINRSAHFWVQLQAFADAPLTDYASQREKLRTTIGELADMGPTWVYNPIGKMFVGVGMPHYDDYVGRAADLAAYIQLAHAQLELRLGRVPSEQVAAFLTRAPVDTRNPFDGKPFSWDAKRRALSFEPVGERWRKWGTTATVPVPGTGANSVPAKALQRGRQKIRQVKWTRDRS